ncbi:MAG: glycosyltransferase family 87 protein [Chloroflexota bacterium]
MSRSAKWLVAILGCFLIAVSIGAWKLGDLRKYTVEFEWLFFSAFTFYGIACLVILRSEKVDRRILYGILALTAVMQGILVFTRPTLSDDMYRYIWDGRVQAHGISPYRYPPNAPELTVLQDRDIYPHINRKSVVTVYPPAAEAAYAVLWRILPDNVHWFQAMMAGGGWLAGILLMGLLRDLNRSPARALIFLWSPLLIFETAHSAHVDGLILPFLVGAWWMRVRERDGWTGFLLGVATALKFYPALLLPFLWRPHDPKGRWVMPLTFAAAIVMFYMPYILTSETSVLGYLPGYFKETFNISPLVSLVTYLLNGLHLGLPYQLAGLTIGMILAAAVWYIFHPAQAAETALRRCILPIGIVTLFSQDLFSWYMLWLLPLAAIFLEPSRVRFGIIALPRLDAWTGWWLFCGLVGLSYTFFIELKSVHAAIYAQFISLYLFLAIGLFTLVWKRFATSKPASTPQSPG